MAMKFPVSRYLALMAVLAGVGLPVAAEDLDAALAAQKKKAARRVYSETALMEDHHLTVPRTETEEDRQLDKKLREMEAKLDAQPAPAVMSVEQSPLVAVPRRPAEDKNWLTEAVLDDLESASVTNETDETWLAKELKRQQELKDKDSLSRENGLVEKLLREKTEIQSRSPEMDRLKQYQLTPPKLFGSRDQDADTPSYMTPRSGTPDPLAAVRWTPKKDKTAEPALFSPAAARISASLNKDPLQSVRPSSVSVAPGIPSARPTVSVFSYGRKDPVPAQPTPIEMIKQASPINRPNPFADDDMPEFRRSIWQ